MYFYFPRVCWTFYLGTSIYLFARRWKLWQNVPKSFPERIPIIHFWLNTHPQTSPLGARCSHQLQRRAALGGYLRLFWSVSALSCKNNIENESILKTDGTMEVLHRSRDDQSNVVLSCSQIFYRKIFNGKSFISSLWPLAPERNAAVMMIKINSVVTRYCFTLMLVTAVNLCIYQYLMYSLSSCILSIMYLLRPA